MSTRENNLPQIVILGAGFAGIRCAKDLIKRGESRFRVVLVDRNAYHTFYPSLYELATFYIPRGKDGRRRIFEHAREMSAIHLKDIFSEKDLELIKGMVEDVDFTAREVALRGGRIISYDYLVVALGSETFYYDIKNLKTFSHGLKTVDDAMNVRDAVKELFFQKRAQDSINIVIGGGGFTGTEFAGELSRYVRKLSRDHARTESRTAITIIEASSVLLPGAREDVQRRARTRLEALAVKIIFDTRIEEVAGNYVTVSNGRKIPHDILIWTAGVKANSVIERFTGVTFQAKSCIAVNDKLQLPHENVFVAGDSSYCIDPLTGSPLPLTATVAIRQGEITAKNILRLIEGKELEEFSFSFPGFAVPIGGKWALMEYKGIVLGGFFGWFGKELIMLRYFLTILPFFKAIRHWLRALAFYIQND